MGADQNSIDLTFLKDLQLLNIGKRNTGEKDIVQTVIKIFLTNSPEILNSMSVFLSNKDYEQAARMAHKLKSSSGNIGAKPLAALLERLEFFNETTEKGDRNALFKSIQLECDTIYATLRGILKPE